MANFNATYLAAGSEYLGVESSALANYFALTTATAVANIRYWQRVFDTGTNGWCYYSTLNAVNPSPASAATSPSWTGTISNPQVVAAVPVSSDSWSLPYSSMNFSRSSQGYFWTQPNTDGSSAFLAVAGSNILRLDNRDGFGSLALLEGSRTNANSLSRDFANAGYITTGASVVVTPDAGPSPDGAVLADRAQVAVNSNRYRGGLGTGALSAFGRAVSGTTAWQVSAGGTVAVGNASLGTTYQRLQVYGNTAGFALYVDAFNRVAGGGIAALAEDIYIDFLQFESGVRFASSPISTSGATVTRSADTLTLTQASVPGALFSNLGRFSQVSPTFATSDLVGGDEFWLLSIGGSSNGIRIRHDGVTVQIEVVQGGVVRAASQPQTWSRDARLGAVRWDPQSGLLSVNGINGPSGVPWNWTPGSIRVGGIFGGAGEAFCRLGTLESA